MKKQNNRKEINRRAMLKSLGLSIAGGALTFSTKGEALGTSDRSSQPAGNLNSSVIGAESMKIVKVESIRFSDRIKIGGGSGGDGKAEFCWVRISTDKGLVGFGETYPSINGELGSLKDIASEYLIGKDPRDIDGIWKDIYKYQSMRNAGGSEMHILSAIDMALLDILGKSAGLPLYRLLGGKTREKVKVYNTVTDYWAINNTKMGPDTEKIVTFLLERGITAMKIYPFRTEGDFISSEEIEMGVGWLKQIEKTAGRKMEILVDGWGGCDLPSAQRVIKACEPYNVIHIEDILVPNSLQSYAKLAGETTIPIAHSETLATRYQLKDFLEAKALDVFMFDLCWCGGITEAKKMCDMADAYHIPGTPHTCGGPLLYVASAHLSTAIPNFCYMESNYWKYTHQYPYFINNVPVPVDGFVSAPEGPGLGVEIRPELFKNGDAIVETVAEI
jgi:L-alanine-DL-glutamate epimerase-like enolase superfamily enzyme